MKEGKKRECHFIEMNILHCPICFLHSRADPKTMSLCKSLDNIEIYVYTHVHYAGYGCAKCVYYTMQTTEENGSTLGAESVSLIDHLARQAASS